MRRFLVWMICGLIAAGSVVGIWSLTAEPSQGMPTAAPSVTAPASHPPRTQVPAPAEPWDPPDVDRSTLPVTDPWAVIPAAPADTDPTTMPSGLVVAPNDKAGAVLWDAPRGKAFAILPVEQYQGPTTYPVVDERPYFYKVLISARRGLPSKVGADGVNGAVGWVLKSDVTASHNPYTIHVDVSDERLILAKDGQTVLDAQVGVGKPATPTPITRTFVMSVYRDPSATYSPYFVAFGTHSPTLDVFNGGPAPTAIHAYPAAHSGRVSNGCVRVSTEELAAFKDIPWGTPVVIVE